MRLIKKKHTFASKLTSISTKSLLKYKTENYLVKLSNYFIFLRGSHVNAHNWR